MMFIKGSLFIYKRLMKHVYEVIYRHTLHARENQSFKFLDISVFDTRPKESLFVNSSLLWSYTLK